METIYTWRQKTEGRVEIVACEAGFEVGEDGKWGMESRKWSYKKLVGEEAMSAIGAELADIDGDKLDAWLGDKSTIAEIEKAATTARELFHGKVNDVKSKGVVSTRHLRLVQV